jgi:CDP-glucose 4,6-dehydratase
VHMEMKVVSNFWSGKKVLITGHTGFKGSWLCLWLEQMGAEVNGFSLPLDDSNKMFQLCEVGDRVNSVSGDVRNLPQLLETVKEIQPEIVFHMAAQPLVRASYEDPVETYATNIMGTVNVLESVRRHESVKVLVNVTTDKCYENREWVWGYRESDPMGGYDPYSSSKGCSELVTAAYRKSFFSKQGSTAIATARAGNVIGGGDWATDRLIPDILAAFRDGNSVEIRNPNATRPWQHVLEPLSGYLLLAQELYGQNILARDAWNFGPTEEGVRPVSFLVDFLVANWASDVSWHQSTELHPHEATLLKLDISKAQSILNWNPTFTLEKTLETILSWEKALTNGLNLKEEALSQINEFISIREILSEQGSN